MTAFAPNWTSRVRISYYHARRPHTLNLRFPGPITGSGLTDILTTVVAFQTALAPLLWDDFTFNSVSACDIDSNIFLPQPSIGGAPGAVLSTDLNGEDKAWTGVFVGRTANGNPAHFSIVGLVHQNIIEEGQGHNFRVIAGENADIDAAIDVLQGAASTIVGNDGSPVTWYDYVNVSPNARQKKITRKSG